MGSFFSFFGWGGGKLGGGSGQNEGNLLASVSGVSSRASAGVQGALGEGRAGGGPAVLGGGRTRVFWGERPFAEMNMFLFG